MVNLLPAVLIGGPPHAGKSVLFYSLTHALRERQISHHAIRACPDGEGNWSQEMDQDAVRLIRIKGTWTDEFSERISRDIERRLLPMLIDMGGYPQGKQVQILRNCTHSILLLHSDNDQNALFWSHLLEENGVLPLARVYSQLQGAPSVTAEIPVIEGIFVGLERGTLVQSMLFDLLVERVASLFSSYSDEELENALLNQAPTELVINLPLLLQTLSPGAKRWQPEMIPALLAGLPSDTAFSVYGPGPHWIYGALAAYVGLHPFYQFDPRIGEISKPHNETSSTGWIAPPSLRLSSTTVPEISTIHFKYEQFTVLKIEISKKHLDYLQAEMLPFPPVSVDKGLILDGSMPSWLLTALVRLYANEGVVWIASHYPPLQSAVIISSHTSMYTPGSTIPMPIA